VIAYGLAEKKSLKNTEQKLEATALLPLVTNSRAARSCRLAKVYLARPSIVPKRFTRNSVVRSGSGIGQ